MSKILAIDDDSIIRTLLTNMLHKAGYDVITAADGNSGLKLALEEDPDVIITDYQMPGIDGIQLLENVHNTRPSLPIIMLTAHGDIALTIKSMQAGAFDYLEKPIKIDEMLPVVKNAVELAKQSKSIKENIPTSSLKAIEENTFIGKSPLMRDIFKNIGRISIIKLNVLITGETGTGKELIARLIHHSGITRDNPMVVVNCASLSDNLLDANLFGYCKGAFRGATQDKKGKFELAGEGSIFLDDISELSDINQARILRVIQEQEFEKAGCNAPMPMRARIIASTNKDLESLVKAGKFREELFYRLKVFTFNIPPLRVRKEDIPDLVNHFISKNNRRLNKKITKVSEGVISMLQAYDWPGNVRELENTLLQAMVMTRGDVLEKDNVVITSVLEPWFKSQQKNLLSLEEIEKIHIRHVLEAVNWHKQDAIEILNLTRPTLNAKIEKYGIRKAAVEDVSSEI
ncbi:MAG TPA: sigma-54 dependent transcriptional regulator [Lentimicrobium sp.]|nr:sigma-54 dependent transcriptional regulator [Lentimicrobium sp.]